MNKDRVIAAVGPTASGKTSLSIALAKKYDGEIICCDSMQVYKYMKVGTASPTDEELNEATHHLFNFIDPKTNYNAALYQKEARKKIDEVLSRGKLPILCGGTGLYAKAALYEMNFSEADSDLEYRKELESLYDKKGAEYLHRMLKEKDEISAKEIHKNNVKRVIRALEIIHLSGKSKSSQKQEEKKHYENSSIIALEHDRAELYERINKRVDIMVAQGLEEEVKNLIDIGVPLDSNAMKAIGYKEWLEYFEGSCTKEECITKIKQNSRHYAKRQLTWFNKMEISWYNYKKSSKNEFSDIFKEI